MVPQALLQAKCRHEFLCRGLTAFTLHGDGKISRVPPSTRLPGWSRSYCWLQPHGLAVAQTGCLQVVQIGSSIHIGRGFAVFFHVLVLA